MVQRAMKRGEIHPFNGELTAKFNEPTTAPSRTLDINGPMTDCRENLMRGKNLLASGALAPGCWPFRRLGQSILRPSPTPGPAHCGLRKLPLQIWPRTGFIPAAGRHECDLPDWSPISTNQLLMQVRKRPEPRKRGRPFFFADDSPGHACEGLRSTTRTLIRRR